MPSPQGGAGGDQRSALRALMPRRAVAVFGPARYPARREQFGLRPRVGPSQRAGRCRRGGGL